MTTNLVETHVDPAAAEEFAGRLIGILTDSSLALMISIGHQVGPFDTLAQLPPATSQEIANAAGLEARYVREWLGAMTTGRIVTYSPFEGTYALPAEHAASLASDAGPANLSHVMQFIPLLAAVEQEVVECFRHGGGVPYRSYERFHTLMAEDSATVHDASLIDDILPLVPGALDRLAAGIDVADIRCGQGHAVNLMAQAFPASRFTGFDFSEAAIAAGRGEAESLELDNARFEGCDVATLDAPGRFDLVRPSTPSTTRPTRAGSSPTSPAVCVPAGSFSWATSRHRATSRTTSRCRGPRSSTRRRRCTA
jgi:Methyltransferase domain